MKLRKVGMFCLSGLLLAGPARALVVNDPYDNIEVPDGLYGLVYGLYSHASKANGPEGKSVARADFTLDLIVLRAVAYKHINDLPIGFQVIVPFGVIEEHKIYDEQSSGLGDVVFGPGIFLYKNNESNTHLSYWFYVYAPTGDFDKKRTINLGQGVWYYEHQLSINQTIGNVVVDANVDYFWYSKENQAEVEFPDRFQIDLSAAYKINDKFSMGLNGGVYWDLDDWKAKNDEIANTKAHKIQGGPELVYQITDKLGVSLRWLHDFAATNDFKGDDIWLRVNYAF